MGEPGQPAMQPYSGLVGLVVTRRVPGSAAVEFCEWAAPLVLISMAYHRSSVNQPRASGSGTAQAG
jgi:hypothetical protein